VSDHPPQVFVSAVPPPRWDEGPCIPPRLAAPIVLVHGLCGFDRIVAGRRTVKDYFPGIRSYLEASGNVVLVPRVSPTASVATRAGELKAYLLSHLGRRPVHLIAHSMGGLDARYMISRLGMEQQVLSLTTIGTPHRGTTFADFGVARLTRWLRPAFRAAGLPEDAFFDLTTERCRRFNETVLDAPGVRYTAVAGICEKPWLGGMWALPSHIVGRAEGPNDGVVSVASATWGWRTDCWDGDHLNLVNWPNRLARWRGRWRDRAADYGQIVRELHAEGY
jgi:triacylglycerol lipase